MPFPFLFFSPEFNKWFFDENGRVHPFFFASRVERYSKVKKPFIMKKIIKETSQVEVTKGANVTPEKLLTVINNTLNSLPGTKKKKVPIVVTKGDILISRFPLNQ